MINFNVMKVSYISPSSIPSKTANSVHVIMQCHALMKVGMDVRLYANRTIPDNKDLRSSLLSCYGINLKNIQIKTFFTRFNKGVNILIALYSLWHLFTNKWPDVILSRNLYASFIIAVILRRPLFFETHQLELGWRKIIQKEIMSCQKVITVVISKKLEEYLTQYHGVSPSHTLILHDAAPDGIEPLPEMKRRETIVELCPQAEGEWKGICGYFGHLYAGRGIEVIVKMAKALPDVLFLIFGGNDDEVKHCKTNNPCRNLIYLGHVSHPVAQLAMRSVDVLLMPYQESVSIGRSGHDTARWMSPMKMFEYMATGVPIISSDLPVLREVLIDGENALLVPPSEGEKWIIALERLLGDKKLADSLSISAHESYKAKYTWSQRARCLIDEAKKL